MNKWLISCIIAIAIIVVGFESIVIERKRNGDNNRKFRSTVRLSVICLAIFVLALPAIVESDGILVGVYNTLRYALDTVSVKQKIEDVWILDITGYTGIIYRALVYILFLVAPIVTGQFVLSIFDFLWDRLYFFFLKPFYNLHIFSDINSDAITLAKDIMDKTNSRNSGYKKTKIIFCNRQVSRKDISNSLENKARDIGAIIIDCRIDSEKLFRRQSRLTRKITGELSTRFYAMSTDKDVNLSDTLKLIDTYKKIKKASDEKYSLDEDIAIAAFVTGRIAETMVDTARKNTGLRVVLTDDYKHCAYELVYDYPLYRSMKNNLSSVLIVGCGSMGMNVLKTVLWCGQMGEGYKLEINVVDRNAEEVKNRFLMECPWFIDGVKDNNPKCDGHIATIKKAGTKIRFFNAKAGTLQFRNVLDYLDNVNYAVVCTENDTYNIDIGMQIRSFYLAERKNFDDYKTAPIIHIRIRDDKKATQVNRIQDYELNAFGTRGYSFNLENLMGNSAERLAVGVHFAYCGLGEDEISATHKGKSKEEIDIERWEKLAEFYESEYNMRSSFATGLHIIYKAYITGLLGDNEISYKEGRNVIEYLKENKKKTEEVFCNNLDKLSRVEHLRWMFYSATEGFSAWDVPVDDKAPDYEARREQFYDEIKLRAESRKKYAHKDDIAKIHVTMVDYDALDAVYREASKAKAIIDDGKEYDCNFKQLDDKMIKGVGSIISQRETGQWLQEK